MSRDDFLRELRSRIGHLPQEELEAAMAYYQEYFDECGDDAAAWEALGSPAEAAARILADYEERAHTVVYEERYSRKGCLPGFVVGILATLSSPLWIPLVLLILIPLAVLILIVFILIFVLAVVGFAILGAAVKLMFISIPSMIFGIGAGLLFLGLSLLAVWGTLNGIKTLVEHFSRKKGA